MAEDRVVLGGFDRNTQKLQVFLRRNSLFSLDHHEKCSSILLSTAMVIVACNIAIQWQY
jgi:hypothetical protein